MAIHLKLSRRAFVQAGSFVAAGAFAAPHLRAITPASFPLTEFGYGDVTLAAGLAESQLHHSQQILMEMSDDSLLMPFRLMGGRPAPGLDLGGWYKFDPNYDFRTSDAGFAPGHSFGQWVSALARYYAISGSPAAREKVLRLNRLLAESISADYFEKTRFPAYTYDKLVCALIDSHQFAGDADAFTIMDRITDIALPHMPPKAITREQVWRPDKDVSYTWDESYTIPENLFLASQRGAGPRYRELAQRYLEDETYFDPLSRGEDAMHGRHAYSYVNALSSAMQAHLTTGSEKHLLAAKNGFDLLAAQSYVTGGWGPGEQLRKPASDDLFTSLTDTHNSFETPCGSYAHFKLTRYLLRVTRDSRYGDSMERVLYNTVLGVKPLEADGHAFYYADYNAKGSRVYSDHRWPCCAGSLPQMAADYRINTYFRDGHEIYVNLYLPSTLKWATDGKQFSLTQESDYPLDENVRFRLKLSHAANFALSLRIPAWAEGASVSINGHGHPAAATAGRFLRIERKWKSGDQITLTLPMQLRLEAINRHHSETVALLRGPLVLFPVGDLSFAITRDQLLATRRVEPTLWIAEAGAGTIHLAPFTSIGDQAYTTYLTLAGASISDHPGLQSLVSGR